MKKLILIMTLIGMTGCNGLERLIGGREIKEAQESNVGTFPIYILAGQSNMMGTASGFGPAENTHILSLGLDRKIKIAQEPLSNPVGAVDTTLIHPAAGVGPGLFFANAMNKDLLLVPSALGSTSINRWVNGADLFALMIERVDVAKSLNPDSYVAGVLFWQGESDCGSNESVESWPSNFTSFVNGVRSQYGNVPIVFVQITSNGEALRERLRDLQSSVSLPNVKMVSSDGINQLGDHTDEAGYRIVGERIAQALR